MYEDVNDLDTDSTRPTKSYDSLHPAVRHALNLEMLEASEAFTATNSEGIKRRGIVEAATGHPCSSHTNHSGSKVSPAALLQCGGAWALDVALFGLLDVALSGPRRLGAGRCLVWAYALRRWTLLCLGLGA